MKFSTIILSLLLTLGHSSAQAFISRSEQDQVLTLLNQSSLAETHTAHFEDIRCSLRSRMCLVRAELRLADKKVGCIVERISDSSEIISHDGGDTSIAPYTAKALQSCLTAASE